MMLAHNSFSSQTWAIFVPNRNSKIKSTVWPTGPPQVRSQNKAYWPYLIKIKEKVGIFAKFGENLLNLWLKIDFIELLCFKCFQNCPKCAFKHIWKPKNLIWKNEFWPNIGILTKSQKLTSHFRWPCRTQCWLNFRVSFRYKNRPCLGRERVMGQHHLCNRSLCNGYLDNGIFRETGCIFLLKLSDLQVTWYLLKAGTINNL